MGGVRLPRFGFEEVLDPAASVRQPPPQTVRIHFPLYQLLPQHPLRDDTTPLLAHKLRRAQRASVQERQNVLRYMIQTL